MASKITVEYDTGEEIIKDYSTWFILKVGDVIILKHKRYRVKSINNYCYTNSDFWVNGWQIRVNLEYIISDNID